jgi:hypothetical protein
MCAKIELGTEAIRAFAGAAALIVASCVTIAPAAAIDLGGGMGLGGNGGSVGGSIGGGGGASVGGSAGTQTGATSNGSLSLGGRRSAGNFNLNNGNTSLGVSIGTGATGSTRSRSDIADAIRNLSAAEQRRLAKKCIGILSAPQRYPSEAIAVCKVATAL